jgi:DMSO/TMAO reductase YedYZ molybdopterin-dependent catalytic subunit
MIRRRDFLRAVPLGFLAASALPPWFAMAEQEAGVVIPGKAGMIVRSARFFDLEMPPEFFDSWITPVPHFFVRNHMNEPSTLDGQTWRLAVTGELEKPLTLSLAELQKLETHTVTNTLECAGNGRGFYQPHVPGVQWQKGAVGTARFSGPRLRDILERAGVKGSGKHVMFHGLDEVPGKVPPFIRSIPIEKAMDTDTLVATGMNGSPLAKHHGFPARALVPGWIGAASCKWLSEVKVLDREFDGNFMKPGYRMPNHPLEPGEPLNVDDSHVVTSLNVKSVITGPRDGSILQSRVFAVQGAAWAGEAEIVKVEVSTDGGASWQPAQLHNQQAKYAWRLWSYRLKVSGAGHYTILSRATDSQQRVQPRAAEWNPSGYLYNAIDQVKVSVQA